MEIAAILCLIVNGNEQGLIQEMLYFDFPWKCHLENGDPTTSLMEHCVFVIQGCQVTVYI